METLMCLQCFTVAWAILVSESFFETVDGVAEQVIDTASMHWLAGVMSSYSSKPDQSGAVLAGL